MSTVTFRPEQAAIIDGYHGGKMGISAVPGSGKTFTLSHLAANLITDLAASGLVGGIERREVLIVTFTNTAVNSFYAKIADPSAPVDFPTFEDGLRGMQLLDSIMKSNKSRGWVDTNLTV